MFGGKKKDSGINKSVKNMIGNWKNSLKDLCSRHLKPETIRSGELIVKKYGMAAAALVVSGITVFTVNSTIKGDHVLELYYNGERVGYVISTDIYYNAKINAESELSKLHTVAYKFHDDSITYKLRCNVRNPQMLNEEELSNFLINDANSFFTEGYGLYIDDTLVAIGENKGEVEAIIDETILLYKELYARVKTDEDIIAFNSRTGVETLSVPKSVIKNKDEIRNILGLDSLVNLNDILLADNSISDEMTISDISEIMPELEGITYNDICLGLPVENTYYSSDDEITPEVGTEETSVSFRSASVEVVREVMPCGEEIVEDDTLQEGKKVLVRSGVYGIKEITYDVVYIDGVEITRTLVEENIVKKPVSKKYRVGTKKTSSSSSSASAGTQSSSIIKYVSAEPGDTPAGSTGTFMFPTTGTITSTFSGRYLLGSYEFHGALDIANSTGTPIYAADGGTVTLAAPFSTYGNCIIIKHDNGMETLYAHLDSYCVKQGDVVGKGWKIAEMGATGRVTGSHLHFEVRVNGQKVDPLNYVSQ